MANWLIMEKGGCSVFASDVVWGKTTRREKREWWKGKERRGREQEERREKEKREERREKRRRREKRERRREKKEKRREGRREEKREKGDVATGGGITMTQQCNYHLTVNAFMVQANPKL